MRLASKILFYKFFLFTNLFFFSISFADNHNIYEIIDQLQRDIKTLEKAVYANSAETNSTSIDNSNINLLFVKRKPIYNILINLYNIIYNAL